MFYGSKLGHNIRYFLLIPYQIKMLDEVDLYKQALKDKISMLIQFLKF